MQPDEERTPLENTPENPEFEPAAGENESISPEEIAAQPVEEVSAAAGEVSETVTEAAPAQPVEEKPAAGTLPRMMVGQPHPKKTFWSKILPWVIVALLFYLGGLATIFFALHQPKVEALKAAAAEQSALADAAAETDASRIIDLTNDYNQALKQYQDAQAELDLTKGELDAARSTIADQDAELTRLSKANIAYKFLVDVSQARTALELQDTATARQAINFAKADLDELKTTDVSTDILAGLAEKLNEASSNLTLTGIDKSREALDTLYTNLLTLIQNLP